MSTPVNYWAVALCAFLNMGLGAIWYSVLFGKPWMRLMGLSAGHMNSPEAMRRAKMGYRVSTICYLIMAWILAHFVRYTGATTVLQGIQLGALLWLGFTLPTMLPNHFFSDRPIRLAWINIGFPLFSLCLMGAILAVWK